LNNNFINEFKKLSKEAHQIAIEKDWYNQERSELELICLIHSELSEGVEGLRKNKKSNKIKGFLNIEEELADTIIRIMDYSEFKNYRVGEAVIEKIKYNKNREYRHGNKKY